VISNIVNVIVIAIVSVVIIVCSIGIIIAVKFQNRQNKKYKEIKNIIKEKKNATFQIKDGLTKEEINNIDSEINVDLLMRELYSIYLNLEYKVKSLDINLDNILVGYLKDFYINKIKKFKEKGFLEINDGIDLINYSITEYTKEKLKFRVTINCFSYKTVNNKIVSGSNLEKIQKIILLTYEKKNDKWLISFYDIVYEKKLSN